MLPFSREDKSVIHLLDATGGGVERTSDAVRAMPPTLADEQVIEVARLAVRAESGASAPQDIEWAF